MAKALLVVIIGAASVSMVLYLIPGLGGMGSASPDTYAVVYPHWYSRILSSGDTVTQARVEQITENQLQQRGPQYADNPMIVQLFEQQVGQQLVQQQVLLAGGAQAGHLRHRRRRAPVSAHRADRRGALTPTASSSAKTPTSS